MDKSQQMHIIIYHIFKQNLRTNQIHHNIITLSLQKSKSTSKPINKHLFYIINQVQTMNYIVANSICCCLQCCCKQLFQTLYKLMGKTSFIKSMYFIIYAAFVSILLGAFVFLRDWPFFMSYVANGIHCQSADDFDCISVSLIYRMVTSIGFFIVFILVIMSLCTIRVSHILNQGLFFSKFVIISVIFIILLQFDNSLYQNLSTVYEYISYIFLICQGIIIIDVGYLWGIRWADKYSSGDSCRYGWLLVVFTLMMFGLAVGMNVYGYVLVGHQHGHMEGLGKVSECSNLPNILNTIFIVLMIGVQLLNFNKQNSLLTTSFLCIYISYWCFSSIYSSSKCNLTFQSTDSKHYQKQDFYTFGTCLSIFWLLVTTFGSIFGSTNKIESLQEGHYSQHVEFVQLEESHQENTRSVLEGRKGRSSSIDESYYSGGNKRNWLIWHFFMLTMIVYLSMVLTDWGSGDLITQKYSLNQNAYWSKIFIASFTFVAYIWTLLAPCLFPDRNFYFV